MRASFSLFFENCVEDVRLNPMAVAMDAAVASIGNDHDVKLKYTVELRALNIQHMKNTLCIPWIPKSPNHQITKFQVFVFRYSGSVVRYGHSCLGIQAQY